MITKNIWKIVVKNKDVIVEAVIFIYIFLFLYASTSKLLKFAIYKLQMGRQIIPKWAFSFVTYSIPPTEIIITILLIIPATRKTGLIGATLLMTVFTTYALAIVLGAFDQIPCTCGGLISHLTWPQHTLFNSFFVLIGLLGIVLMNRRATRAVKKDVKRLNMA